MRLPGSAKAGREMKSSAAMMPANMHQVSRVLQYVMNRCDDRSMSNSKASSKPVAREAMIDETRAKRNQALVIRLRSPRVDSLFRPLTLYASLRHGVSMHGKRDDSRRTMVEGEGHVRGYRAPASPANPPLPAPGAGLLPVDPGVVNLRPDSILERKSDFPDRPVPSSPVPGKGSGVASSRLLGGAGVIGICGAPGPNWPPGAAPGVGAPTC